MQEMSGSTCVIELKREREKERECVEGVKSKLWIKSLCFSLGRFFFFFKKKKEDIIKNVKCGTWDEKKKKIRFEWEGGWWPVDPVGDRVVPVSDHVQQRTSKTGGLKKSVWHAPNSGATFISIYLYSLFFFFLNTFKNK